MLAANLAPAADDWHETASAWTNEGRRVLIFAFAADPAILVAGEAEPSLQGKLTPLALLSFTDELRPDARATLEGFRQAGIKLKVISGDNPQTVTALARKAGMASDGAIPADDCRPGAGGHGRGPVRPRRGDRTTSSGGSRRSRNSASCGRCGKQATTSR